MTETTFAFDNRALSKRQVFIEAVGARVRDFRVQKGMTLQQLGEATGVSQSMLSMVERGKASASIGTLMAVADALGVRMSDLLVTEEPARAGTVIRSAEQPIYETDGHQ